MTPALIIKGIEKTFNPGTITENYVLKGVDLVLEEGDYVTVIGGNGAGKSTLLNSIAGTYAVDEGQIFIKDVDVDWIQSKYLLAEPGEYIVVARQGKKKGQWFCGGVTDDHRRSLEVPMDFLDPGKTYVATIYADADDADYKDNPHAYRIWRQDVTSADVLSMTMARGGGFAISFEEK